mgnify:CR=1 FL=1
MRRLLSKDPTFGLFLAFALMLTSVPVTNWLETRRLELQELGLSYQRALFDTRSLLATQAFLLFKDPFLANPLGGELVSGLQKRLVSYLSASETDKITIYDASCHLVATVSSKNLSSSPCEIANKRSFSWQNDDGVLSLSLWRTLDLGQGLKYQVAAEVALDESWLILYPEFSRLMKRFDFELGAIDGESGLNHAVLVAEGKTPSGPFVAALFSRSWPVIKLAPLLISTQKIANIFFIPFALLSLLFALAIAQRRRWQIEDEKKAHEGMQQWLKNIDHQKLLAMEDTSGPLANLKQTIRMEVGRLTGEIKQQQSTIMHIQEQLVQFKKYAEEAKRRLLDYGEHESLALQVKTSALVFAKNLEEYDSQLETLAELVRIKMLKESGELFKVLNTWKKAVQEKGARKFMRSLYETIDEASGQDQLTVAIWQISQLAMGVSEAAIQCSLRMHKLRPAYQRYSKILTGWYALALSDTLDKMPDYKLIQCLESAYKMHQGHPHRIGLTFADKTRLAMFVPIRSSVLVAGLFHILNYLAKLEVVDAYVGARRSQTRGYLTFACQPKIEVSQLDRDLELARLLLESYSFSCSLLPSDDGRLIVSVSWQPEMSLVRPRQEPNLTI